MHRTHGDRAHGRDEVPHRLRYPETLDESPDVLVLRPKSMEG